MSKTIQLRNVPDALHRKLKARAALEGLSLSAFLIREAHRIAGQRTDEEIRARLAALPALHLSPSSTELSADSVKGADAQRLPRPR